MAKEITSCEKCDRSFIALSNGGVPLHSCYRVFKCIDGVLAPGKITWYEVGYGVKRG